MTEFKFRVSDYKSSVKECVITVISSIRYINSVLKIVIFGIK